jgi:hypothetical protein
MERSMVKMIIVIPVLLFMDWIIMIFVGCISGLCGAGERFYCNFYCYFGISLLILTVLYAGYLFYNQHIRHKFHF